MMKSLAKPERVHRILLEPRCAVNPQDELDGLESTASLLELTQGGDLAARDRLLRRYLPVLRCWAHGRLPASARDLSDTDDLVQVALLKAMTHLETFKPRHAGSFLAYLRKILQNMVRDEVRRAARAPVIGSLETDPGQSGPTPLDRIVGREFMESYEEALPLLGETVRLAVVLRLELGLSHQEVAEALGLPSANAARMTVARGLVKLAELLDDDPSGR